MTVDSFARRNTPSATPARSSTANTELAGFLGVHEAQNALADERRLSHLRRRARLGERFRVFATDRVFETLMREHYLRGLREWVGKKTTNRSLQNFPGSNTFNCFRSSRAASSKPCLVGWISLLHSSSEIT
jgi:hypothetical protein